MLEKLFNAIFNKNITRNITVLRGKREIGREFGTLKRENRYGLRDDTFWDNRGRLYGNLFNSLNGRWV